MWAALRYVEPVGIRTLLAESIAGYHYAQGLTADRIRRLHSAHEVLREVVPDFDRVEVHVGLGGNQTFTPWIGMFRFGAEPQRGIYPVYFLSARGSFVVLSLQHGTENRNRSEILATTEELRASIPAEIVEALETSIDLEHEGRRQKAYELAHVVGRTYRSDALPSESALVADLLLVENALICAATGARPGVQADVLNVTRGTDSRLEMLVRRRRSGDTLEEIANDLSLTRERVRQLLAGVPGAPTAKEARAARKARDQVRRDHRYAQIMVDSALSHDRVKREFLASFDVNVVSTAVGLDADVVRWSLESSGIDHRRLSVGRSATAERWTDDQILEYIRLAHEAVGKEYLSYSAFDDFAATQQLTAEAWPTSMRIVQRFDKWAYACETAGIPFREVDRERLFDERTCLLAVASYLDDCDLRRRRPTYAQYDDWARDRPSLPSGSTVRLRLRGGWAEILSQANHLRFMRKE